MIHSSQDNRPGRDAVDDAVSALCDGALSGAELADTLDLLTGDPQAQARWNTYHAIGDMLRSSELAPHARQVDFIARLEARLAGETVSRPLVAARAPAAMPAAVVVPSEAANDRTFRWKLVAGAASLAAVVAVTWSAAGLSSPNAAGPQLASAGGPAVVAREGSGVPSGQQVMIRNAQLDELLAAHSQALGGSGLNASGGFVRNASFSAVGDR